MAKRETAMTEHFLVLDRRDLGEIYTRLETEADWHRLSQRVYVLNRTLGRRAGARFILRRDKATLRVCFSAPERFTTLLGALREGRGFVQKALAERLERRAGSWLDCRSVPRRLISGQAAMLKEMLSRDLGIFAAVDLDAVLLDVAFPGCAGSVAAQAAGLLPGGALVLGESGSGKTALLYRLLRHWESYGPRLAGHAPVYIPAKHLHFSWGAMSVPWAALPGVEAGMVERLEAAFDEGRLALLIDGINENPGCVDFTNPGVQSFWKTAGRNATVITASPRFYESHVKVSPLKSIFAGGGTVTLPPWGPGLYRALFDRLAEGLRKNNGGQLGLLAGCLNKLCVADWQRLSPLARATPLTGLAAADYFMNSRGERLPKDENELLDHWTSFYLRHEGFKGNVLSAAETVLGLLMRLAWQSRAEGRGGRYACVSTDDALRVIHERYPALEERKGEVLHFLSQLPFLEHSPENGLFCMSTQFADFLAAKFLIRAFLSGDIKGLREALRAPWEHPHLSRFYLMGLGRLSRREKSQFLSVSRELYEACREGEAACGGRDFVAELVLARLLQPLGFLDLPEAREFLRSVSSNEESREGSELALMSAAIGLAWSGEPNALEAYAERIHSNPKAARFNLAWFLFYRRNDRLRSDLESFNPDSVGRWETACDWLLGALTRGERDFASLRPLHAASLFAFWKALGPGPFLARAQAGPGAVRVGPVFPAPEGGAADARPRERLRLLGKVVSAWRRDPPLRAWPALKRPFGEMAALAAQGGGDENGPEKDS